MASISVRLGEDDSKQSVLASKHSIHQEDAAEQAGSN